MIPVGGAEITQADTLWAGLSGVLESRVGGVGWGADSTGAFGSSQEHQDSSR